MTLFDKQRAFPLLLVKLIQFGTERGFDFTMGEAWRTPEQARLNAKAGIGIARSLHILRLAIDLNAFKGGKYLTRSEEYTELGEFWESLSDPATGLECCWGGRFNDGNHFSIEHQGVR